MTAGWGHFSDSRVAKSRAEKGAFLILAKVKRQLVAAGNQRVKQSCHVMSGGHNGSELIFPPRDVILITMISTANGVATQGGMCLRIRLRDDQGCLSGNTSRIRKQERAQRIRPRGLLIGGQRWRCHDITAICPPKRSVALEVRSGSGSIGRQHSPLSPRGNRKGGDCEGTSIAIQGRGARHVTARSPTGLTGGCLAWPGLGHGGSPKPPNFPSLG
ncbi:predicted protein [Histoplasma capsulatum H143]|uniref:Uncharacterized protein n=1 Tax=Ajellomyces capsulatus (strain H143) TaxID=544712 RepID=C6HPK5_AJECH|nr:predicted protein [Histoplasma capsulatum H143]